MFLINSCIQGGVQPSLDSKQMFLQGHGCNGKIIIIVQEYDNTTSFACALQSLTQQAASVAKGAGHLTTGSTVHDAVQVQPIGLIHQADLILIQCLKP